MLVEGLPSTDRGAWNWAAKVFVIGQVPRFLQFCCRAILPYELLDVTRPQLYVGQRHGLLTNVVSLFHAIATNP